MDKHTEIIFNLFIMEYFEIDINQYMGNLNDRYYYIFNYSEFFKLAKSCFPENEYCAVSVWGMQYNHNYFKVLQYDNR